MRKREPDKYYVADFETTGEQQFNIEEKTKVWAWGLSNYSDYARNMSEEYIRDKFMYGVNLESFFDTLHNEVKVMNKGNRKNGKDTRKKRWLCVFFHNLEFDGYFILDYLQRLTGEESFMGIQNFTFDKEYRGRKHVKYLINASTNTIYNIIIESRHLKIEFRCSLKLLTVKVGNLPYARKEEFKIDYQAIRNYESKEDIEPVELDYLFYDIYAVGRSLVDFFSIRGEFGYTASGVAFKSMRESIKDVDKKFPIIEYDLYKRLKRWYNGGYVYVNPKYQDKVIKNVYSYDINSSYPAQMKLKPMPYGLPLEWDNADDDTLEEFQEKHKDWNLYLYKIRVKNFAIKGNHIPFVSFERTMTRFKGNTGKTYLSHYSEEEEEIQLEAKFLYLTSPEYELFCKYYTGVWEIVECLAFRSKVGMYDKFIDKHYENKTRGKLEGNKALEKNSKLLLNGCYGKEAMNPVHDDSEVVLEDDKIKINIVPLPEEEQAKDSDKYMPASIFITSYGRIQLHEFIQPNCETFVYSDTDSVKTVGEPNTEGIYMHDTAIGGWGFEYVTDDFKVLCPKRYAFWIGDKFKVKCAGFSRKDDLVKNLDDFSLGKVFPEGKRKQRVVAGGKIITNTQFTLHNI